MAKPVVAHSFRVMRAGYALQTDVRRYTEACGVQVVRDF